MLLLLWACSSDSSLHPIVDQPGLPSTGLDAATDKSPDAPGSVDALPVTWEEAPLGEGSATEAWSDPATGIRREVFEAGPGAGTPLVDYLFVVDDSVSMHKVLDPFRQGFESLRPEIFPASARIAVMTMTPADPDHLGRAHPAAHMGTTLAMNPGFLKLVTHEGLVAYKAILPEAFAKNVSADGCNAWFAPSEMTASGTPCIVAHTRLGLTPNQVEAGLVSFQQLLEKQGSDPLFRQGAAVNVVFVSDTHDPGFLPESHRPARSSKRSGSNQESARAAHFDQLLDLQLGLQALEAKVAVTHDLASLRFHAIAPRNDCGEAWEDYLAPVYFDLAEESGGVTLDVCTATDYTPVVQQIVEQGSTMQSPRFVLGEDASEVSAVLLDGEPVGWGLGKSGVLEVDTSRAVGPAQLEVRYTPKAVRERIPRDRSRR